MGVIGRREDVRSEAGEDRSCGPAVSTPESGAEKRGGREDRERSPATEGGGGLAGDNDEGEDGRDGSCVDWDELEI